MRSVKRVGSVLQKVYGADGLTIACQVGLLLDDLQVIFTFCSGRQSGRTNCPSRPLSHSAPQIPF